MYAELNQKVCTKGKHLKDLKEFHKNKRRPDGLSAWCKECKRQADAANYTENTETIKATTKSWKQKNPDRKRELNREYKKRNKTKVNALTQKYKQKNRGVTNANTAKRRAALLQRTPKWLTEFDFRHIKAFYEAAARLTKEFGIPMEVDHMIPLQGKNVSGLHVPSNLQILTEVENTIKKNRYKV